MCLARPIVVLNITPKVGRKGSVMTKNEELWNEFYAIKKRIDAINATLQSEDITLVETYKLEAERKKLNKQRHGLLLILD